MVVSIPCSISVKLDTVCLVCEFECKVLSNEEKKIYKSRITIENTFLKIKKNKRL